jgi:hypothetical protein
MWARCKQVFGMEPSQGIETSDDRLSVVKQMYINNMLPCFEFSIFGPHGRRARRHMTYASQVWGSDRGTYRGPRTLKRGVGLGRCSLLMLYACEVEPLDLHSDFIRNLHIKYGQTLFHHLPSRRPTQVRDV